MRPPREAPATRHLPHTPSSHAPFPQPCELITSARRTVLDHSKPWHNSAPLQILEQLHVQNAKSWRRDPSLNTASICLTYTLNTGAEGNFRHCLLTISFLMRDFHAHIWGFWVLNSHGPHLMDKDIEVSRDLTVAVCMQVRNCLLSTTVSCTQSFSQ